MSMFESNYYDQHERVEFIHDPVSHLHTIIAVHDSTLGPGCGGCRLWPYATSSAALDDVLRLSRGMSYKNALAGLPIGGGKAVIIAKPGDKTPALMRAFGRCVNQLNGKYITAEDVGVTEADMLEIAKETPYVGGLSRDNHIGGDPSPFTAKGVFLGLQATWQYRYNNTDLSGVRVMVQGVGNVGFHLCQELCAAGAVVLVADVNPHHLARVVEHCTVQVVAPEKVFEQDVDIFAPCAMGAVLNDKTIAQLTAKVIAGAANNQLAQDRHGELLAERDILYAPDYVINSGGVISVWSEFAPWQALEVQQKVKAIFDTTTQILQRATDTGQPTHRVADQMAREVLHTAKLHKAEVSIADTA